MCPDNQDQSAERTLEGVLMPVAWGAGGEVLGVGLMTFDEREYPIDHDPERLHQWIAWLRKRVRLSAVIRDERVVRVTRCELLEA